MSNKSELRIEFFVGFFVALVLAGLAFFTIIVSGASFFRETKFKIEVVMPDAMGLRKNDFVIAKGTSIGSIDSVRYDTSDGVHVTAVLDKRVELFEDYRITVVTTSILGGRQLVIQEGTPGGNPVKDLMNLRGDRPADLMEDATEAMHNIRKFLDSSALNDALENLGNFSKNISEISDRLNAGEGTIGRLLSTDATIYDDLASSVADIREVASDFKSISARLETGNGTLGKLLSDDDTLFNDLSAAVADARAALANLNLISARLESGEGTLGRLLSSDDAIYTNLAATVANLNTITTRLETGEGTLGKLLSSDSSLYDNVDGAIRDARETLDDLREASTLTTVMSLLFSGF